MTLLHILFLSSEFSYGADFQRRLQAMVSRRWRMVPFLDEISSIYTFGGPSSCESVLVCLDMAYSFQVGFPLS